ncbi:hypothetical protein [Hymenobacter sp. AT01-02]|uniref:hypothetical protein n=1 Tax=Hymenobacter sp. AT01-02 TaxID=1571877 RepID=UPI000698DE40|nr:hypothetical protein [Hymenobacter sp. AT01-02]
MHAALEQVYRRFARYRLRQPLEACPCCITPAENALLWTVPLRQLSEEQLRRYAFKAMTTWGSAEDFRYFLPRLLHLASQPASKIDKEVFFGKIGLAGWATWPPPNQEAVRTFLLAWWQHHIRKEDFFEQELLSGLVALVGNLAPLLAAWQISFADRSFSNLVSLLEYFDDFVPALRRSLPQADLVAASSKQLNQWLVAQLPILEQGFFQYISTDSDFAARISRAHTVASLLPA